ncbi:TPA: tail fiber assembly protein [Escherichia coli]|nr:tail fiber assembly protein [Escherichia coli]EIH4590473.1 tail fiber assembly protein [Escherichia coli]EKC3892058.1 tail fiber assembly protein [Escherichia coli]EKS0487922.1 tail fiber assembly protein [Escherichia coli]EKT9731612.1 tail fiber assembly protein [Escherichia coli]
MDIATEEEKALLAAWKKYRVLLNRVDTSVAPDIEWPAIPVME